MEDSILISTKKMLGLDENYTPFDFDVTTYINTAFSDLYQLGVGIGEPIEDSAAKWSDLDLPTPVLSMVKTFVNLKVKMWFDPPGTSYLIDAANKQIEEHTYRLINFMELESLHIDAD